MQLTTYKHTASPHDKTDPQSKTALYHIPYMVCGIKYCTCGTFEGDFKLKIYQIQSQSPNEM